MADRTLPDRRSKQRLFFALWPDAIVREQIAVIAASLFSGSQQSVVPIENYHLTIAFLGAVSPATIPDIVVTARSVRFASFDIVLQQTGYWQRSRVAWLSPAGCPQSLATLADDLWNKLAGLGLVLDSRQFRPHVTLARELNELASVQLPPPVHWRVQSFALLESTPGSKGPVYTVLEEFPVAQ
jgi:RNA 2',3'-cyclic 3'-phosphodiesterase